MKKTILLLLKVLISVGGIAFIVNLLMQHWAEVSEIFMSFRPGYFALAALMYCSALLLITYRLNILLEVHGAHSTFGRLVYFTCIGQFFNLFLPSAVGGDVVKAFYIHKNSGKKSAAFTTVLFDRIVGSITIAVIAMAGIAVYSKAHDLAQIQNAVYFVFACLIAGLLFLMNRRAAAFFKVFSGVLPLPIRTFIKNVYDEFNLFSTRKTVLIQVFLLSLVSQTIFISVHYMIAKSLNVSLDYFSFFLVIPVVSAISMAPSINGLGIREAGFVYFFKIFTSAENALAISLAYDALIYVLGLLFGVWYLIKDGFRYQVVHQAMEEMEQMEGEQ